MEADFLRSLAETRRMEAGFGRGMRAALGAPGADGGAPPPQTAAGHALGTCRRTAALAVRAGALAAGLADARRRFAALQQGCRVRAAPRPPPGPRRAAARPGVTRAPARRRTGCARTRCCASAAPTRRPPRARARWSPAWRLRRRAPRPTARRCAARSPTCSTACRCGGPPAPPLHAGPAARLPRARAPLSCEACAAAHAGHAAARARRRARSARRCRRRRSAPPRCSSTAPSTRRPPSRAPRRARPARAAPLWALSECAASGHGRVHVPGCFLSSWLRTCLSERPGRAGGAPGGAARAHGGHGPGRRQGRRGRGGAAAAAGRSAGGACQQARPTTAHPPAPPRCNGCAARRAAMRLRFSCLNSGARPLPATPAQRGGCARRHVPGWHSTRRSPGTALRPEWPAAPAAAAPDSGDAQSVWTSAGAPHLRSLVLSKVPPAPWLCLAGASMTSVLAGRVWSCAGATLLAVPRLASHEQPRAHACRRGRQASISGRLRVTRTTGAPAPAEPSGPPVQRAPPIIVHAARQRVAPPAPALARAASGALGRGPAAGDVQAAGPAGAAAATPAWPAAGAPGRRRRACKFARLRACVRARAWVIAQAHAAAVACCVCCRQRAAPLAGAFGNLWSRPKAAATAAAPAAAPVVQKRPHLDNGEDASATSAAMASPKGRAQVRPGALVRAFQQTCPLREARRQQREGARARADADGPRNAPAERSASEGSSQASAPGAAASPPPPPRRRLVTRGAPPQAEVRARLPPCQLCSCASLSCARPWLTQMRRRS